MKVAMRTSRKAILGVSRKVSSTSVTFELTWRKYRDLLDGQDEVEGIPSR